MDAMSCAFIIVIFDVMRCIVPLLLVILLHCWLCVFSDMAGANEVMASMR